MMIERFIELLRVPSQYTRNKQCALVQGRLIGIGLGYDCPRCWGCGRYSFNGTHSICYQCNGRCQVVQRLTQKLYNQAAQLVAEGKLDSYLAESRRKAALVAECRGATDAVMKAWGSSGVSANYDWSKSADEERSGNHGHDWIVSHDFNLPMCKAYEATQKATDLIDHLNWKRGKVTSKDEAVSVDAEILAAREALIRTRDESLAIITERTAALQLFLQSEATAA